MKRQMNEEWSILIWVGSHKHADCRTKETAMVEKRMHKPDTAGNAGRYLAFFLMHSKSAHRMV